MIQGNRIGAQAYADRCLPNKTGITLALSKDNLFGTEDESLADDLGNVIVCNGTGIETITGVVERNTIGFNRIGELPGATENVGNTGDGVVLNGAKESKLVGNTIGNNGGDGVLVTNGASQTTIGGPATGSGNTITNNGASGVRVDSSAGNGNLVDPNKIFGNALLGIDIGEPGPAPNDIGDADEGPNRLQNYPEIVSRTINENNELIVSYRLTSAPGTSAYGAQGIYIEFFKADTAGEGGVSSASITTRSPITTTARRSSKRSTLALRVRCSSARWTVSPPLRPMRRATPRSSSATAPVPGRECPELAPPPTRSRKAQAR